jgi:hypothetical protein
MKRSFIAAAATLALGATVAVPPAVATADSPALGTSYATAAKVTPGGGITTTVTTGGAVGGLLDFLTPVLEGLIDPLTSQLLSLPGTVVNDLSSGLSGAGLSANSPSSPLSPPSSGYPDCSSSGWSSDTCFGPLVPNISAAPLLTLGTGTLQGYAAADSSGAYGKARTAGIVLSLLGLPLGTLGVAESSSRCLTGHDCTSGGTLTGLSLLGGAIAAQTGSDGGLQVSVGGGALLPASSLSAPVTVNAAGLTASVQSAANGTLQVSVGLGLSSLLSALGIGSLDALNGTDAGSTIALTLTIGSGASASSTSSSAWGLEIGLGIQADIAISVLGIVSVGLSIDSDSGTGNLADLQLAYSAATPPDNVNPSGAPPALT